MTAPVFKDFLRRPILGSTGSVYIIVDGHPIHKLRLVKNYVDELDGQL